MGSTLSPERADYLRSSFKTGFIDYCGFEAVDIGPGRFEARVEIKDHHRQQDGFVHAGVMATLADHTAGYAAYTLIPDDCRILTIEFKINFLRPAHGGSLVCRAKALKPGKMVIVLEADVFDVRDEGEVQVSKVIMTAAVVSAANLARAE
ncbi:MAG: PaaI family thioesterase [Pseudomonadota bacterium]